MPRHQCSSLLGLAFIAGMFAAGLLGLPPSTAHAHPDTTDGPAPSVLTPLTPSNATLVLIDFQPDAMAHVPDAHQSNLLNNAVALAKSAVAFDVSTLLTGRSGQSDTAALIPDIAAVRPHHEVFTRPGPNFWDDPAAISTIERLGQSKLIFAAPSIETGVTLPALQAMVDGYQVYVVTDASGATSSDAHEMAVARLIQAGVIPVTWQQVTHEWLAASPNATVQDAVTAILKEHAAD
ncbi:MAG: isochorismatase family protein [Planctomycetota bacterium]